MANRAPDHEVESILEGLIHRLSTGEQTREARAVLIEARRLRNATMRWSAIPPPPDARREMLAQVMTLVAKLSPDASYLSTPPVRSGRYAKSPGERRDDDEPDDERSASQRSTVRAPDGLLDEEAHRNLNDGLPPPGSLRARPLSNVSLYPVGPGSGSGTIDVEPGIRISRPGLAPWASHPSWSGVRIKILFQDVASGVYTALIRVSKGAAIPARHHAGPEQIWVVHGSLELDGTSLHQGDYCRAEAGTIHPPMSSANGCTLLVSGSEFDATIDL